MNEINQDERTMRFFPQTMTDEQTLLLYKRIHDHFHQFGYGFFAAELKKSERFIGFIGLGHPGFQSSFTPCVEIGWRLNKDFWNKGLATEGATSVLEYAFHSLKLDKVYSFTATSNRASERVMKKIGMHFVGSFMHPNLEKDHWLAPHVLYRIFNSN